jgi:NTP pyrophosphatase (non-canonical NTP hydrolase)
VRAERKALQKKIPLSSHIGYGKKGQECKRRMILERVIEAYGKDMQLTVAVEELSELIKELCKNKRGNDNRDNIIEELADCYIVMEQIEIIFNISGNELHYKTVEKLNRLERRLAERNGNESQEI